MSDNKIFETFYINGNETIATLSFDRVHATVSIDMICNGIYVGGGCYNSSNIEMFLNPFVRIFEINDPVLEKKFSNTCIPKNIVVPEFDERNYTAMCNFLEKAKHMDIPVFYEPSDLFYLIGFPAHDCADLFGGEIQVPQLEINYYYEDRLEVICRFYRLYMEYFTDGVVTEGMAMINRAMRKLYENQ